MATIESVLIQRKNEFISFLKNIIPLEKQKWINDFQNRDITELVLFFKQFVIGKDFDLVIDSILEKLEMKREQLNKEDLHKLKLYLELFSEFINEL